MDTQVEQVKLYYYDNQSLLISSSKGLVRLHCPFKAECIKAVNVYKEGDVVKVVAVHIGDGEKLLYLIDNKLLNFHHFHVLLKA